MVIIMEHATNSVTSKLTRLSNSALLLITLLLKCELMTSLASTINLVSTCKPLEKGTARSSSLATLKFMVRLLLRTALPTTTVTAKIRWD